MMLGLSAAALMTREQPASAAQAGQHLEGSWIYTVTIPGLPQPFPDTFKGLVTFIPGGSVVETSWAPSLRSNSGAGHGTWVRTGDRQFAFTFAFLWFDQGTLFVTGKARASITVDEASNVASGPGS